MAAPAANSPSAAEPDAAFSNSPGSSSGRPAVFSMAWRSGSSAAPPPTRYTPARLLER